MKYIVWVIILIGIIVVIMKDAMSIYFARNQHFKTAVYTTGTIIKAGRSLNPFLYRFTVQFKTILGETVNAKTVSYHCNPKEWLNKTVNISYSNEVIVNKPKYHVYIEESSFKK